MVRRHPEGPRFLQRDEEFSILQASLRRGPSLRLKSGSGGDDAGAPLSPAARSAMLSTMDAVTLTRQLVDIESITGNEAAVANYLYGELCRLGYDTRKMPVEGRRFNVYATSP